MTTLCLPARINANHFLAFLKLLKENDGTDLLRIDFSQLISVSPPAATSLVATIDRWRSRGRDLNFTGIEECQLMGYLQRMNILSSIGLDFPENFIRREPHGRFIPLQQIADVDSIATQVAECLAPGGQDYESSASELYDLIQYVFTEAGNNVLQHSRGKGFALAQSRSAEGLIRIAIADNGIGILRSFQVEGIGWAQGASDVEAVQNALLPKVSSKGAPINAGVGLTLVSELTRALGGWFGVISGNAHGYSNQHNELKVKEIHSSFSYHGTLLAIAFKSEEVDDWPKMLTKAKIRSGLLPVNYCGGRFAD